MNEIFPITGYAPERYAATREAFRRLIQKTFVEGRSPAYPNPETAVETFAGIGGQTRIIQELLHPDLHVAFEKDEGCFEKLVVVGQEHDVLTFHCEYRQAMVPFEVNADTLLVVDGAYSLAQHRDYLPYHHPEAGWLIICEQARTRLHLHRRTYGLGSAKGLELYEEYLEKVEREHDRPLMGYEVTKYSPSYVLLGPVRG